MKWKIYGYKCDFDFHYKWEFAGVVKAKDEFEALTRARKVFKFLRNQSIKAEV